MTKFQKQMLTIAAAGALTAVTALPAMAFENEFHGIYNFNAFYQNYDANYAAATNAAGTTLATAINGTQTALTGNTAFLRANDRTDNYMEQRVRLQYIAKASDDLKLVTHFEINNRFGQSSKTPVGSAGGGQASGYQTTTDFFGSDLDTDGTNIVTKNAYLDFNITKNLKAMVGLQGYKDSIGGIFINADVPAVVLVGNQGATSAVLGFTRYNDTSLQTISGSTGAIANPVSSYMGDISTDLTFLDLGYQVNKSTKVGVSYYYLHDDVATTATAGAKTNLHTFALNGKTKVSDISLSGFAALQTGKKTSTVAADARDYSGYALNAEASAPVAGGTATAGYLYVSGDQNSSATKDGGWVQTGVSSFDQSGMLLMLRNNYNAATSTVYFLKGATINNISLAYLKYDKMLTDKLGVKANVGFGWDAAKVTVASNAVATTNGDSGKYIGTEFNGEVNYKLYANLTALAQAGVLTLGNQFDAGAYKNPYTVRAGLRFAF